MFYFVVFFYFIIIRIFLCFGYMLKIFARNRMNKSKLVFNRIFIIFTKLAHKYYVPKCWYTFIYVVTPKWLSSSYIYIVLEYVEVEVLKAEKVETRVSGY